VNHGSRGSHVVSESTAPLSNENICLQGQKRHHVAKQFNVLIFPGGTEIGLEIRTALGSCKEVKLFSAGLDVSNHAPFIFERHFCVPGIHEPGWIDCLNGIVDENDIDYIFPAYDDVLVALAENLDRIKARVVSSPPQTCFITRSKLLTYRHLNGAVPVPMLYESPSMVRNYPVFLKPEKGQGSQRTCLARDSHELAEVVREAKDLIILEYLPGEEYTVDCFTDRRSGLLFCGGRERVRVRSGISMNSRPVEDVRFAELARAISERLTFYGAWFFQVKRDTNGMLKLLEVAPRIAGTMALHRVQGVNFPLLSIYEQEGVSVTILRNHINIEIDRCLINRYRHDLSYTVAYIDLDDTLVLDGEVNVNLVKLLYQCINKGVRVVLLTRHAADLETTLGKHRLTGIFDKIIHVAHTEAKADHITESAAIFVDDSFSERKEVSSRLGIPTFDSSMIEMLFDERR
jgi:carbamoyl-phosphate synthase large subunit